jgi:mannitol operon transcriptional antiterminator
MVYSPKERQNIMTWELLINQEPVKLFYFSKILKVSEATISNDLDKVGKWFRGYSILLVRRQGTGVYIEGKERDIRKATINFIYENMDENQLVEILRDKKLKEDERYISLDEKSRSRLLNLMDKGTIIKLEDMLFNLEHFWGVKLTDDAYIGLLVHMALAVERIKKGERIVMEQGFLAKLKQCQEYKVAERIAENLSDVFEIDIPEDEIGYITMHIKGARSLKGNYNRRVGSIGNFEIVRLSKKMIKIAERESGCSFKNDDNLLIGLVNHLGPVISRLNMNMDIRNPLLQEIKDNYPELMDISRKSVKVVEDYIGIEMPESEIAYIAMHIGAAIEKYDGRTQRILRAAVACPSGIGASVLLASLIEREYENIQVVDVISAIHIDEKALIEKGIDIIVSTVPIKDTNIPVIVVSPLLSSEDKSKLQTFISNSKGEKVNIVPKNENIDELMNNWLIQKYHLEGAADILNSLFVMDIEGIEGVEDLINIAAKTIGKDESEKAYIYEALNKREELGSTILPGQQLMVLHARVPNMNRLHFGVLRFLNAYSHINGSGKCEQVNVVLVMLAPDACHRSYVEPISHISKTLVEDSEGQHFLKVLREGNSNMIKIEIANLLDRFIKSNA